MGDEDDQKRGIVLSKECGVQSSRFGEGSRDFIKRMVLEPNSGLPVQADGEEEEDEEQQEEEQEDVDFNEDYDLVLVPGFGRITSRDARILNAPARHSDNDGRARETPPTARIPVVARSRLNLTALSKDYNLYFAAYQGQVYVYRPRRAPHILRRDPDVILAPRRTRVARLVRGYIDAAHGHQINHIITGQLGDREILLLSFDDGDVVAYYIQHVVAYVAELVARSRPSTSSSSTPRSTPGMPRPFFQENVGKSAWGLAVHQKSRLIAVSSNLHEVTVFAFALACSPEGHVNDCAVDHWPDWPANGVWSDEASILESQMRARERSWRIVLPLPTSGSNVPSISFLDEPDGRAECVVAADINAQVWILQIWIIGGRAIRVPTGSAPHVNTGWGVLVLHGSDEFRSTTTLAETTGLESPDELSSSFCSAPAHRTLMADISEGLFSVPDNASDSKTRGQLDRSAGMVSPNGLSWDLSPSLRLGGVSRGPKHAEQSSDGTVAAAAAADDDDDDDGDDSEERSDDEPVDDEPLDDEPLDGSAPPVGLSNTEPTQEPTHFEVYNGQAGGLTPDFSAEDLAGLASGSSHPRPAIADRQSEALHSFRHSMTVVPALRKTFPHLEGAGLLCFARAHSIRHFLVQSASVRDYFLKASVVFPQVRILLTDRHHVRLLSLRPDLDASVICRAVLFPHNHHNVPAPWDMRADEEGIGGAGGISMLCRIPELNLVVLGALFGRVALLTLTEPTSNILRAHRPLHKAFRVDAILPGLRDEVQRKRPHVALHGIAVSPIYEGGWGPGDQHQQQHQHLRLGRPGRPASRWRLLLHYVDHTILEYEIARPRAEEDVLVEPVTS